MQQFVGRRGTRLAIAGLPPTVLQRDVMGRTTAAFFFFIGLAGVALGAAMPVPPGNRAILLAGAVLSIVLSVVVAALRARLSPIGHVASIVFAVVVLTALIGQSPSVAGDVAMASLYTCVACHAALMFSLRNSALITALAVASCVGLAVFDPDMPWWSAIPIATATALIGAGVSLVTAVARAAVIDHQTGLLNRRGFDFAIEAEINTAAASGDELALILLDLDGFKSINDDLGRSGGDRLIRDIATRWRDEVGRVGIVSRYGGDEFAVLVRGTSETAAAALADRLRSAVRTACSVGVTGWLPGDTVSLFIGRADVGLFRAKRAGGDRIVVESSRRPALVEQIRDAIREGAFHVHFQPIVRLSTGNGTVAVEALVRWHSPPYPDISPEGIVQLAEDNGLIADLGRLVLEEACTEAERLRGNRSEMIVSVNVSGAELGDPAYCESVLATLARLAWSPERLVLEVTERDMAADSPEAIRQLTRLRSAGIRIAIDDFGSGYSSLARIAALPCDILKIDRAVIADVTTAPPLLDAITAVAAAFQLAVIVEGIETAQQAELLAAHGIDFAQGYYFARPQPAAELFG
ncbi:putative bifunctional diguanylate cyclase/phosphodiesterase [Antrihabitans cavernicola]|uniref:Bifunctional diguanylate cyclase/phosphodiesterase n=1 Tax=Antrihabitans cavernicola TaxID=2495913 RepID=A0A5A7SCW6_9NOCA|nr:bifunctional diguanylate cyclase/phosphodiesterase [Spelaeibacter cavernicola]KAA0022051.1 bifunctional diguanylate cyclase/phosphodiesterase [Spelaeibacter cavernicola]